MKFLAPVSSAAIPSSVVSHQDALYHFSKTTKWADRFWAMVSAHLEKAAQTNVLKAWDSNPEFLKLALEAATFAYKVYPNFVPTVYEKVHPVTMEPEKHLKLMYPTSIAPMMKRDQLQLIELWVPSGELKESVQTIQGVRAIMEDSIILHYQLLQQSQAPIEILGGFVNRHYYPRPYHHLLKYKE